jgi:serine/threonine protein kinase
MTSQEYDNICDEIYRDILDSLNLKSSSTHQFATRGTSAAILRYGRLVHIFESLGLGRTYPLSAEDFARRIRDRNLYDFLATIVFGGCGISATRTFTEKLVAISDWQARDRRGGIVGSLPLDHGSCKAFFDDDVVAVDKFMKSQPVFCAVVLKQREELRIANPDLYRRPYLEETKIGEGAFGRVFRVKIAAHHFYNTRMRSSNDRPEEIARKEYLLSSRARPNEEREIMETIFKNSSASNPNIVETYGSLEWGTSTFSMFMPLAVCDLKKYMTEISPLPPSSTEMRAEFIKCVTGLANGLAFLHKGLKTTEFEELVCFHMDLKPENVLIFHEEVDGKLQGIWKIGDFGMARFRVRRRHQEVSHESNFRSWFLPRQAPADPSVDPTINRRGEGTYLPPESLASRPSMRAESDVWSLGCILSVFFIYLEEGSVGVSTYSQHRCDEREADGMDRFFVPKRFGAAEVNSQVKRWHRKIIKRASERNSSEGSVLEIILKYLEDYVFTIDQVKRARVTDAVKLQGKLEATYGRYRSIGSGLNDSDLVTAPGSQPSSSQRLTNLFRR